MSAIRLPESIERRLDRLAKRTGRTKTFYARQAILRHLNDLEDLYKAECSFERIRDGKDRTIRIEEVMRCRKHENPLTEAHGTRLDKNDCGGRAIKR